MLGTLRTKKYDYPIAWDTETHLIKPGMPAPRLVCVSVSNYKRETALLSREPGLDFIESMLDQDRMVLHNAPFDLGVAAAERPKLLPKIFRAYDEGRIEDTMIREMMIQNAKGELKFEWNEETNEYKKQQFNLAYLIWRRFGRDVSASKKGDNIWRLRYNELDGLSPEHYPEAASKYAIEDAIETQNVWIDQDREVKGRDIRAASQVKADWALSLCSTWGFRTDPIVVAEFEEETQRDFDEQVRIGQEWGFRKNEEDSVSRKMKPIKDAVESWYREKGLIPKRTEKGAISTDRESLTGTDHPGLLAVSESIRYEKLLKTYISALKRGVDVPLNPRYNVILETFRTSCHGGMKINKIPVGLNIQNQPRKGRVRECIIPRDGNVFAFCDYDTLEMRTLAQVCIDLFGFSDIRDAIVAGQDLHLLLAAELLGMPYKQALDLYNQGDKKVDEVRQYAKIGNYGLAGGMGAQTFIHYAKNVGIIISMDLARRIHGTFRKKWKEMIQYFEFCADKCQGDDGNANRIKFVRSGLFRGNVSYTAVCNGYFQHLAAMGAKEALYEVSRECYLDAGSPLYGSRPWLFCHDEIGLEIPYDAIGPEGAHNAAMRLQELMIKHMRNWTPDVPIGASVAMTRRWHKGAKAVYDKNILIPVKPEGKRWVLDAGY